MSADKSTFKELVRDGRRVTQFLLRLDELDDNDFIEAVIESKAFREDLKELTHYWAVRRVKDELLSLGEFKKEDFLVQVYDGNDLPSVYLDATRKNNSLVPGLVGIQTRNFKTNVLIVEFCGKEPGLVTHTMFIKVKSNGDFIWDLYKKQRIKFPILILTGSGDTFYGLTKEFLLGN